jgi:hypothetical protein
MPTGQFGYDIAGQLVVPTNTKQMKLALMLGAAQRIVANGGFSGGNIYLRPDGTSRYFRPDGTSFYIRP